MRAQGEWRRQAWQFTPGSGGGTGKQETARPSRPARLPLPQRVTERGAGLPRACHRGAGRPGKEKKRLGAALERSRAHGPAGMALIAAPAPGQTALPSPQWPPPTSGRTCLPRSRHCSSAPDYRQVGVAASRKCPLLQTLTETQLAGSAWSSCLQAEPRVARQPMRARLTRSKFLGETRGYQQPAAGAPSRPARFPERGDLSGRSIPALGTTYKSPTTTTP